LTVRAVTESQTRPRTGPVLAVVSGPDARVLAAVAGIAAELALDEDLRALLQVLVHRIGQLAPCGDAEPGRQLPVLAVERLFPAGGATGRLISDGGLEVMVWGGW